MRTVLIASAVATAFAITAAKAEPTYVPGGPIKQGSLCQVSTDDSGDAKYGIWVACPNQPAQMTRSKKKS